MSVYGIMANLMKYGRAASTEQIVKQTVEARWYLLRAEPSESASAYNCSADAASQKNNQVCHDSETE